MGLKNLPKHVKHMDAVLMKIKGRDAFGRVKDCEIIYDDESVDISDPANRQFLVVGIEKGVLETVNRPPKAKG